MKKATVENGYEQCSGCACCLLSCPLWERWGDMSLTPKGWAKALQWGASVKEIATGIDACLLCGACLPACPEEVDIIAMTLNQRRRLNTERELRPDWHPRFEPFVPNESKGTSKKSVIFLTGELMEKEREACETILELLGGDSRAATALNDGRQLARAIDAGLPVEEEKVRQFLSPLTEASTLVVGDGTLIQPLRNWLPKKKVISVGEALIALPSIRKNIGPCDLYVIESRHYNTDFSRLVRVYDRLRKETDCQMNLDLNRIAIPTGASSLQGRYSPGDNHVFEQAKWILKGRKVKRIIVEEQTDLDIFRAVTDLPVMHLPQLAISERVQ